MSLRYHVVELSLVTDETLTEVLNRECAAGWQLDGIHFAMGEGSRRPAMAFLVFVGEAGGGEDGASGPA